MAVEKTASLTETIQRVATRVIEAVGMDLADRGARVVLEPYCPPGGRPAGDGVAILQEGTRYACGIRVTLNGTRVEVEYAIDAHKAHGLPDVPHPDGLQAHKHWTLMIDGTEFDVGNVLVGYTPDQPELRRIAAFVSVAIEKRATS